MSKLPKGIEEVLFEEIYKRNNKEEVRKVLNNLGVKVSETFEEFFTTYRGHSGEDL